MKVTSSEVRYFSVLPGLWLVPGLGYCTLHLIVPLVIHVLQHFCDAATWILIFSKFWPASGKKKKTRLKSTNRFHINIIHEDFLRFSSYGLFPHRAFNLSFIRLIKATRQRTVEVENSSMQHGWPWEVEAVLHDTTGRTGQWQLSWLPTKDMDEWMMDYTANTKVGNKNNH